jgi:predicted AlkP superfamily pyrophosphatase or phosphodiesterase
MTHSIRAALATCLCLVLSACATATPSPATDPVPVVLVSIDGFRNDYLDRGITPHLSQLAVEGVRGDGMRPSYPALTFPNHWTLVTGLRPDRHGVVHNVMRDPAIGRFKAGNEENAGDARWWNGGEPIWVTAENAGLRTATMFWPGSQAPVHGVRPTHWIPYDETVPDDARVDQIVQWLASPERIRLATLYFELLDDSGHGFGPHSKEVDRDIARIDATIGRLVDALDARGIRANLVIVSDHGMAEVAQGHAIAVEDMVDARDAALVANGQAVQFMPKPGREREAEATLLGRHDHYACWKKGAMPPQWHYGTHPRVPPIVCQMDQGWDAIARADIAKRPAHARGSHGFDPALPSMRAVFVANGPAFRKGVRLPVFDNVDLYPLLAKLLGVPPREHDGTLAPLQPALR